MGASCLGVDIVVSRGTSGSIRPHSNSDTLNALTMNETRAVLLVTLLCTISIAQTQPAPARHSYAISEMSQAQLDNFPAQLLSDLERIKSTALTDDYAYQQVAHLTENIGPRPSGSPQAKAAVDYVAA